MMRRSAAGFVVVVMLLAGARPCAGWQSSAEARHDCCVDGACPDSLHEHENEAAGQTDLSQEAADRCCAASEEKGQRDQSQSAAAFFAVSPPAPVVEVLQLGAAHLRGVPPDTLPITHRSAPLYVLFSVFLV